jgi:hypothetical protein
VKLPGASRNEDVGRLRILPLRVLVLNAEVRLGAGRITAHYAKVRNVAQREQQELTGGTRTFVEAHTEPADKEVLPL